MYSCFQSREFDLFQNLSDEQLGTVNTARKRTKYKDSGALIRLRGNDDKGPLKSSPFIRSLEYGANLDGYWGYDNMVEQLEDCIDVIKILYQDEFDSKWMFDQSSGHCKKARRKRRRTSFCKQ